MGIVKTPVKKTRGRPPKKIKYIEREVIKTMDYIKKVDHLNLDGNISENWRVFWQNFEIFGDAIELSKKPDTVKVAVLLNAIGPDGVEVFNSFGLTSDERKLYKTVCCAFANFCKPKKNEVYQSFLFHTRNQLDKEPFDSFLMDIKKLVKLCGFDEHEPRMLRDRIVLGVTDKQLQKKLLESDELTLEKAIDLGRTMEVTKQQASDIQQSNTNGSTSKVVDAVTNQVYANYKNNSKYKNNYNLKNNRNSSTNTFDYYKNKQTNKFNNNNNKQTGYNYKNNNNDTFRNNDYQMKFTNKDINCVRCRSHHKFGNCPAFGKECLNCGRPNHFAVACTVKKIREINLRSNEDEFVINALTSKYENNLNMEKFCSSWFEKIRVEDVIIPFKLDTGAEANVLPLKYARKMKGLEMRETSSSVEVYGGSKLPIVGEADCVCMAGNNMSLQRFFIIDTDSAPILGLNACTCLKLIKRIYSIGDSRTSFIDKNADLFEGLGCFIEDFSMELKENAVGSVRAARRIPLSLMERVRKELDEMESKRIIERVNEPTDFVSNLVIVEKTNGRLRLCLDPQALNRAIKEENHPIPTFEQLAEKLNGKRWFTVLDLKEGFWQVKLNERSSKLCTFSTPFGCYRFNRLPFGVKICAEVFQKYNERNFEDIEGVNVFIDDIIISANSVEEHDRILEKVVERARERNVRFNRNKLQYRVQTVKYLGHVISEHGISVDPKRTEAIEKIEPPKDKKDLQKLLGMINYVRKFIPNLADLSHPLRELLKKNIEFIWLPAHSQCFDRIKKAIVEAPVLRTFDGRKEITVETDASQFGVGCALLQDGRPVYFASRSLNQAEIGYAQIEKELLAIVFACYKFHFFIYGRNVTVRTDHKPLISIMKKDFDKIPSARLQRMKLRLIKYKLNLFHIPGKDLYIADLLSRYFNKDNDEGDTEGLDLDEVVHSLNISNEKRKNFQEETSKDPELKLLKEILLNGWPNNKKVLGEKIRYYYRFKDNIFLDDSLIFLDDRVIVPTALRSDILEQLHQSHLGFEKTKARARSIVFWPGINNDIENRIVNCSICQKYRNSNVKDPMISYEIPRYPFQNISLDFCDFNNRNYLILYDFYSRYLDIIETRTKTANEVIRKLKDNFANHGIPRKIIADNMPFGSFEFASFCRTFDIELVNTSPTYSQANGFIEKGVGIAKSLLKKSSENRNELWLALLEYRNTPLKEVNASPTELLMSRKTRTLLPAKIQLFDPSVVPSIRQNIHYRNARSKRYYDRRGVSVKNEFNVGQNIWFKNGRYGWVPGIIMSKFGTPRSYWIKLENGSVLRRNAIAIRPRHS